MSKVCAMRQAPRCWSFHQPLHRTVNRKFKPNIQRVTVFKDGRSQKMNVCTAA